MGFLFSKFFPGKDVPPDTSPAEAKVYSWDKRNDEDWSNLQWIDKESDFLVKQPGAVSGKPFTLRNLVDCRILLLDNMATVNVDNCSNCVIFIGPTEQSVFLRNCTECNVVVSCQQFRMRACHKMNVLLHSVTQPIIETSFKIKLGCFRFFYSQLLSQMKAAGLSPFMNCWYNIHDFSPNSDDSKPNYSYLTSAQVHETLSLFDLSKMEKLPEDVNVESLQFDMGKNVVPSTREHLSRKSIMTTEDIFSTNHQAPLNAGKEPRITSLLVTIPFENRDGQLNELIEKVKQVGRSDSSMPPKWSLFDCLESPLITQEELNRVLFSNTSKDISMTSFAGDDQTMISNETANFTNKIKSKGKVIALAFDCNDSNAAEEMTKTIADHISPFKDFVHTSMGTSAKNQFENLQKYVQMQCN